MARKATQRKLDIVKLEKNGILCPTPAQMARATYESETEIDARGRGSTKRVKRVRQLEAMYAAGSLSDPHYRSLKHYRHHAETADKSPIKDSLDKSLGGGGDGMSATVAHANIVAGQLERAAGALCDILRAVAVDDKSISQWAMEKYGAIEERYHTRGRTVVQLKPRRKMLEICQIEFRMAAIRVDAEISGY